MANENDEDPVDYGEEDETPVVAEPDHLDLEKPKAEKEKKADSKKPDVAKVKAAEKIPDSVDHNSSGIKRPVIWLRGGREERLTWKLVAEVGAVDSRGRPGPLAEDGQKVQRMTLMLKQWENGATEF